MSNKDEVLVSICVVTFQHVNYIEKCLEGLLMQETDFPFEIILGEDESTDGTREICKTYAKKYPNLIKLFLRNRSDVIYIDGKPSGRFNYMENLKEAKGTYIALCDGDDFWVDPKKLQKQIDFLKSHNDYILSFTSNFNLYPNGTIHPRDNSLVTVDTGFKDLLEVNYIVSSTAVFENPLKDTSLPTWFKHTFVADWALFLWLTRNGRKIHFNVDYTTTYRKHTGLSTAFKSEKIKTIQKTLKLKEYLLNDPIFKNNRKVIKHSILNTRLQLMASYNKQKMYIKSLPLLIKFWAKGKFILSIKVYAYSFKQGLNNA